MQRFSKFIKSLNALCYYIQLKKLFKEWSEKHWLVLAAVKLVREVQRQKITGYKRVCLFSLPAETVRHIWLPPRLSVISCFLLRLPSMKNGFLQRLSVWICFLPRLSAGSRITRTVSAGSYLPSTTVWAGNKRSWTVLAEAKYDKQSLQEAKFSGLVYTL